MSVHVRCVPLTPVLSWLSFTVTLSALAAGVIVGCGTLGYELALRVLLDRDPDLLA